MTTLAPRRAVRTYQLDGRELYADTGRPVDERLGSHVVLWIVDDAEAWAQAIEREGDAELAAWPKSQRYIGESRREQRYASAALVRAAGNRVDVYSDYHTRVDADASVASLYRGQPNPGVRYEAAPITAASACPTCCCPTIQVNGVWYHHTGRYPTDCGPQPEPELQEPDRTDGEFEINVGLGSLTCGYCNLTQSWPQTVLGYQRLTGFHLLGVHRETNTLVVLVEATTLNGSTVYQAHHCLNIPEDVHQQHAPHTILARPQVTS